jgi:hypothetical protein
MLTADIRRAVGAPPSEEAVMAGLRTADLFRNLADVHLETIKELRAKLQALEYANACKAEQIAALRAELNAGRDAANKAALVDHALNFEGSSLVLVRMRITGAGQWTTEPVVDLEHASQIMAADLEQPDDTCDCIACNGTGEGQHEGASCAVCGGRG